LAVVAYDVIGRIALTLAGREGPPLVGYVLWGALPDALLNGALAFVIGGFLLRLVAVNREGSGWV
jgi:hypothetical protein